MFDNGVLAIIYHFYLTVRLFYSKTKNIYQHMITHFILLYLFYLLRS